MTASAASSTAPRVEDDDHALVAQIQGGDPRALERLFHIYVDALAEFAYHYVRSESMAQDVVQEVFITLWDRRVQWHIHGSVAGYLFRATRNRALNLVKHERIEARVQAQAMQDRDNRVVTNLGAVALETEEFHAHIRRALATLPPRCREIFLLHREEGMSYQHIAEALGIGLPTIHNQMSRAMKQLAAAINTWRV